MVGLKFLIKDKKKPVKATGEFIIYLRVTKDRKRKYIATGLTAPLEEWDDSKERFTKQHKNARRRNIVLNNKMTLAESIIDRFEEENRDFTLHQFDERYRTQRIVRMVTVYELLQERIMDLAKAGKMGTRKVYYETCKSFFGFTKRKNVTFSELDTKMLDKYEIYLREKGGTDGGISIRMRTLRALFRKAIELDLVNRDYYPFDKYKISKFKGGGIKKALSREEVQKIIDLDLDKHPKLTDARHWFVFSYYTRGVARHSFATNLKHAGVSTNIISESMGHRNQQITETYLKSFENEVIDDAMEVLL